MRRLGYRRAKCPAVALWWIIHELNCSICGLIIFTVVTDQHSAAISVQAVDDVGYSLETCKRLRDGGVISNLFNESSDRGWH